MNIFKYSPIDFRESLGGCFDHRNTVCQFTIYQSCADFIARNVQQGPLHLTCPEWVVHPTCLLVNYSLIHDNLTSTLV